MLRVGQSDLAPKARDHVADTSIVSRDHDRVDTRGGCRTTIDMFNHRSSSDVDEGLSRKTTRVKPGGDNDDDRRRCGSSDRALGRNRVHGEYYHTTFRRAS